MAKYGNGVSFESACAMEREQIEKAFLNQKVIDETDDGFIYGECTDEEAQQIILDAFDEACFQAQQAFGFGRAIENYLKEYMGEEWYQDFTVKFIHSGMIEKEGGK